MRSWLAFAALGVAVALAPVARAASTCGKGGATGDRKSVDYEGSLYYVTTPAAYSEAMAWPLIIGLHGDEGDPAKSVNFFWREVTDDTFIFVAPKAPNASGSWYEEQAANSAWMDGLVESLLAQYNVDLDRVYLWGLSGGSVFSSRYVMDHQDLFAAVEFNMGGSGRQYQEPVPPACKIPARFVTSQTDFLRESALGFYNLLLDHGHEAVWVDADCQDHCFDQEQAGPVARDWLLSHTLCGHTPSAGCEGLPGGAGSGNAGSGNAGSGNAGSGNAGGPGAGGGAAGNGPAGAAGTSALAGAPAGGSGGSGPGSQGQAGQVMSGAGSSSLVGDDKASPTEDSSGCACAVPGRAHGPAWSWLALLVPAAALGRRRRLLPVAFRD